MPTNFSLRPSENTDWIAALDAVHQLAPVFGSDRKAKKAIIERLQDSAIMATAWWLAEGYDVGPPYIHRPVEIEHGEGGPPVLTPDQLHDLRVESSKPVVSETRRGPNLATNLSRGPVGIGGAFWNSATAEDRVQWDWSSGLFKCSFPNPAAFERGDEPAASESEPPRLRLYALGVHFYRPDIDRIGTGARALPDALPSKGSNAGRKRSEDWPRWIAEVVWLHHEQGIGTLTANGLVNAIEQRAAEQGFKIPSRSAVHETAIQVVQLLNERMSDPNF